MKLCLLLALAFLFATPSLAQDTPDHSTLFDTFEGEWVLHTYFLQDDGARHEQDAKLHVTRMESKQAPVFMFEERHASLDDAGLFIGRVMYAYHEKTGQWRGTGVNTLANRKWRDVAVKDGEIVFLERGELFEDRPGQNRFAYINITKDSFELRSEYTTDGKTWGPTGYGFIAKRVSSEAE